MTELVIISLDEVQANDLAIIPCQSTSLPISLHECEVDNVQELLFVNCLLRQFEYCQNCHKRNEFMSQFVESAITRFSMCMRVHKVSLNHLVFDITIKCLIFCISISSIKPFRLETCFINCYESSTKKY